MSNPSQPLPGLTAAAAEHARTVLWNRVPEVTLVFWIIKVLSTTTGETAADYLNDALGLGIALVAQFATRRHLPAAFWTVVVLISIVRTLVTDNPHGPDPCPWAGGHPRALADAALRRRAPHPARAPGRRAPREPRVRAGARGTRGASSCTAARRRG